MSRTVLITGVAGFLGRYVVRQFARAGWHVIGLDDVPPENAPLGTGVTYHRLRLPDPALCEILRVAAPQACVHCAGRASVPLSLEDPSADFRANTVLTFELLEALRRAAPQCRFLFLSSAAVYGNPAALPISETSPLAPLSPYGYHKLQGETLCEEFSRIFDLPTASVRIFSAYGPGLRRQVIWDICQKVLTTGALRLQGTGGESRDFIHAADVARALSCLADRAPARGEIYNLASGREVTITDLAQQLVKALGKDVPLEFDGVSPPGNPRNWRADISRISALGFVPEVGLDDGLRAIATWSRAELGLA
jgi:UDP-glucose 4-epimerase